MKKLTVIALFFAFAILVAGCSQSAEDMAERKITQKVIESNSPEDLMANMCSAFIAKSVDDVIALTHPETRKGVRGGRIMNSTSDSLKAQFAAYDIEDCQAGAIKTVPAEAAMQKEFKEKHNIDVSLLAQADYKLKTNSSVPDSFLNKSVSLIKVDGKWYIYP